MTFDVEIMLRGNEEVFAERLAHDTDAKRWTERDVESVLRKILTAMGHVISPGTAEPADVSLRGVNWIANTYQEGVVLALEIHSACAVAGPFHGISREQLERLTAAAVRNARSASTVH
jgi:hypothetical protein